MDQQAPRADRFPEVTWTGQLRPAQREVVELARRKLAEGQRRLHIVAPPGSGKTLLGLYLWAECVRRPTLVLSPNSAIQAQWVTRSAGFQVTEPWESLVSTNPQSPGWLTSLTYQAVTLPKRADQELDAGAREVWVETLIKAGQAEDEVEAVVWINDLQEKNPSYYAERLALYRKAFREQTAVAGMALEGLHLSAKALLETLKSRSVGMIVLDECHHVTGHWGRILADAREYLDQPLIVGLTATPPATDDLSPAEADRYADLFGPVDFEIPVPAVVKDGFLAPYQDLVYFVRPTESELAYVASVDQQFHALINELCTAKSPPANAEQPPEPTSRPSTDPPVAVGQSDGTGRSSAVEPSPVGDDVSEKSPLRVPPLPEWLLQVLTERRIAGTTFQDWEKFERRDPKFAWAARVFLLSRQQALPADVPEPELPVDAEGLPELSILGPVLDRYVRLGLRRSAVEADRALGERITEQLRQLGWQITEVDCRPCTSPAGRVIAHSRNKAAALIPILTAEHEALGDRLRAVVVTDYEKSSVVTPGAVSDLDSESGGAIAAFRLLVSDPRTDLLDPILVTGSTVLIDDDLLPRVLAEAQPWLAQRGLEVELIAHPQAGFSLLEGRGADWSPRVYVGLITELFQRGITRCLIGTRGLLGEGWDANKLNVLIDLTTVTTAMSVNQLRGRSFRLDPAVPEKLSDNWDVVCLAPEFAQGLEDYDRFRRKHDTLFGAAEDGMIEKGVGHIHASFTELQPEGLHLELGRFNDEMVRRVGERPAARSRWRIGEAYHREPAHAVEVKPRVIGNRDFAPFAMGTAWSDLSLARAVGETIRGAFVETKQLSAAAKLACHQRDGGYVRVVLHGSSADEAARFAEAYQEVFAPLHRPRYIIPRIVQRRQATFLSRWLPQIVGRYFERHHDELVMWHAVPSPLAKNKELADIFQRHWNARVSPGEVLYGHQGAGKEVVRNAHRQRLTPAGPVHVKEVFLTAPAADTSSYCSQG